eukprot:PhF_6_TR40178/c0_g1_i2/m.59576
MSFDDLDMEFNQAARDDPPPQPSEETEAPPRRMSSFNESTSSTPRMVGGTTVDPQSVRRMTSSSLSGTMNGGGGGGGSRRESRVISQLPIDAEGEGMQQTTQLSPPTASGTDPLTDTTATNANNDGGTISSVFSMPQLSAAAKFQQIRKAKQAQRDAEFEMRLKKYYARYAPDKATDEVVVLLKQYKGKEEELFRALVRKYGPEPNYAAEAEVESSKQRRLRLKQGRHGSGVGSTQGEDDEFDEDEDGMSRSGVFATSEAEGTVVEGGIIIPPGRRKSSYLLSMQRRPSMEGTGSRRASIAPSVASSRRSSKAEVVSSWAGSHRKHSIAPLKNHNLTSKERYELFSKSSTIQQYIVNFQRLGRAFNTRRWRMKEFKKRGQFFKEETSARIRHCYDATMELHSIIREALLSEALNIHHRVVVKFYDILVMRPWKLPCPCRAQSLPVFIAPAMSFSDRQRAGNAYMKVGCRMIKRNQRIRVALPPLEARIRQKTFQMGNDYMKQGLMAPPLRHSRHKPLEEPTPSDICDSHHERVLRGNEYMKQGKRFISKEPKAKDDDAENSTSFSSKLYNLGNQYMSAVRSRIVPPSSPKGSHKANTDTLGNSNGEGTGEEGEEPRASKGAHSDKLFQKLWHPMGGAGGRSSTLFSPRHNAGHGIF